MIYSYCYLFSGFDHGGIASADMKVKVVTDPSNRGQVEVTINNLSPTSLLIGSGHNLPAISAFGFDIKYSHLQWQLSANKYMNRVPSGVEIIGEDGGGPHFSLWHIGPVPAGAPPTAYVFSTTFPSSPDGRLYSPDAIQYLPLGALPYFATETEVSFNVDGGETPLCEFSNPWILMTHAGLHGHGRVGMRGIGCRIS